jgi:hypothetical protein
MGEGVRGVGEGKKELSVEKYRSFFGVDKLCNNY